jgi:ribosomal protein S18 acetylase RimI-like enzyme
VEDAIIRAYRKDDRKAVRDIAFDTAFMGKPADVFFDDREILADFLTLYYTDFEPESSFVAEARGEVAGYLIGTRDVKSLTRAYVLVIAPRILFKAVSRGTIFRKKNLRFILFLVRSLLRGEFNSSDPAAPYPATLHINIREDFRGRDIGSKLIESYLSYLSGLKISGVHVSTLSDNAVNFFESNGFTLLNKRERSYFKNILGRNIWCGILARRV